MNSFSAKLSDATNQPGVEKPARTVKLRYKLLVLMIAMLMAILGFELILQIVAPQYPSWLAIYRVHPSLETYAIEPNVNTVVDIGEGRYTVRTDENGWRIGSNGSSVTDQRPVVLVIGDSYTFGHGVSYEDSMVGRLDASTNLNLRPINAGVGGYGPVQYRMVLEYLLGESLDPRFVLLIVCTGNDFHDCIWTKNRLVADGILYNPRTLRAWVKRSSHLYRLFSKAYHQYGPSSADPQRQSHRELAIAENWETGRLAKARTLFSNELARMKDLCHQRSLPLGVVIIPMKQALDKIREESTADDDNASILDYSLPVWHTKTICEELGLECLDLTSALLEYSTEDTYLRFDGHFTPFASRLAAEVIRDFITQMQGDEKNASLF